jgi:nuclear transport factor 2 (NTF2) superfamily protein
MGDDWAAFKSWLDDYGLAWESRNPEAAAVLYADDGTYQVTPFLEPMRGRNAIFEYWAGVAKTEENIRFGYEILVANAEVKIARWWASFVIVPQGQETQLDGIFLVALDGEGHCKSLREWWHKKQK